MSRATAARALLEAATHIGYHEGKTGGVWDNTNKFGKRYGWDGVAWCQIWVWCILQDAGAGKGLILKTASCAEGWRWFAERRQVGGRPRKGALIYFGPGGREHVGIVESFNDDRVTYISGNTTDESGHANSVQRKTIPRSSRGIHGYAYPAYAEPKRPLKGALRVIRVRPGQNLTRIAAAAGITLAALLALNPHLSKHPDLIRPGDKVTLPAKTSPPKFAEIPCKNP